VFTNLPFRQNAVSVVINAQGQIFIAKFNPEKDVVKAMGYSKKKFENFWQLPQGGTEEDEDVTEGAKRELWEETAMRNVKLISVSENKYSYLWKDQAKRPLWVNRRYQYKGQEQRIVYFRFTGQEKEIVLDWDELVEYKWVKPEELLAALHEEKQPLARLVLEGLKEMREKGII
jgi:putative (di)nucleoside polyphosphate hydrolase